MPGFDVFKTDAFNMTTLTAGTIKAPFRPRRIAELGLFFDKGIRTKTVMVEEKAGLLSLIPTSARGGVPDTIGGTPRTARSFIVPHLARETKILADEIEGVRSFGSESELEGVQAVVNDRLATLRYMHEVTLEYLRIGAIKGTILDSNGTTTIYNLFTEFGVAQQVKDFVFGTTTTDILATVIAMKELIEDELGGDSYQSIRVLCSATWFAALVGHTLVRDAYKYQQSQALRSDLRAGFSFGDVDFEVYRGSVGGVPFIPTGTAYAFPMGVITENGPLFTTYFAPADFVETVNEIGLPIYVKQAPDPDGLNRFVKLHSQSNPLPLCLRPRVVVKCTQS